MLSISFRYVTDRILNRTMMRMWICCICKCKQRNTCKTVAITYTHIISEKPINKSISFHALHKGEDVWSGCFCKLGINCPVIYKIIVFKSVA